MWYSPIPETNPIKGHFSGWLVVILDIYLLSVAFTNLGYNRRGAIASERIARELKTINQSQFMQKLNGEIKKENTYGQLLQNPKTD